MLVLRLHKLFPALPALPAAETRRTSEGHADGRVKRPQQRLSSTSQQLDTSLKLKQTPETVDLLSQQVLEAWVQFDVVFPQVAKQLVRPQDLGDSDQLNHENKSERVENSNCEMFYFSFWMFLLVQPDRSCPVRGRRALSERSYWPTCSPGSTCPDCSHTSETHKPHPHTCQGLVILLQNVNTF